MRKLLIIISLLLFICFLQGCREDKSKVVRKIDHMLYLKLNNPMQYEAESHGCKTYMEYIDSLDKEVKDYPFPDARGNYVPMRSSDKSKPDTIVDGIHYRHI